jgi:DNA modification methylase
MIKPYYDQDGITLYLGDCREILPQLDVKVDLLTDPPYGIGEAAGKNKSRGLLAVSKDFGIDNWDDKPVSQDLIDSLISYSEKAIIFGGNYYKVPPSSCWLIWDKDNGATDFADCEMAWTNLTIAVRRLKWRWQGMLQEDMANKEFRYHPTQKPLAVMKWCLSFLKDNNAILDPFLGSGTTALAAKILGRKCIGIKIEEKYCKIAVERLRQSVMRLDEPPQNNAEAEVLL